MGTKRRLVETIPMEYKYVLGNFYIILYLDNDDKNIIISDIEILQLNDGRTKNCLAEIWTNDGVINAVKNKLGIDEQNTPVIISEYAEDKIKSYLKCFS